MDAAFTRTSASPGPITGTGTVSSDNPFAALVFRSALIVVAIDPRSPQAAILDASIPFSARQELATTSLADVLSLLPYFFYLAFPPHPLHRLLLVQSRRRQN